jgi:hypothetical protein
LKHYATSWKVAGSRHCKEIFFLIYLALPAPLGPEVYITSKRNEYQKQKDKGFWGVKRWRASKADNLTAICGPIPNISLPYRPARTDTGITLLFHKAMFKWIVETVI